MSGWSVVASPVVAPALVLISVVTPPAVLPVLGSLSLAPLVLVLALVLALSLVSASEVEAPVSSPHALKDRLMMSATIDARDPCCCMFMGLPPERARGHRSVIKVVAGCS
jgi:hypothetical protein